MWVDRTTSRDFATGTICATVMSLSPFAIAPSLVPSVAGVNQIADLIDAVRTAQPEPEPGLVPDLVTKLREARQALEKHKTVEARFKLDQFKTKVNDALDPKKPKLTARQAASWLAAIGRIEVAVATLGT